MTSPVSAWPRQLYNGLLTGIITGLDFIASWIRSLPGGPFSRTLRHAVRSVISASRRINAVFTSIGTAVTGPVRGGHNLEAAELSFPTTFPKPPTALSGEPQPQLQSPLFTKLPPEIRNRILKYALGNHTFHLLGTYEEGFTVVADRLIFIPEGGTQYLGEVVTSEQGDLPVGHELMTWQGWPEPIWLRMKYGHTMERALKGYPGVPQLSSVLQTCRQLYIESEPLLYTENIHHLSELYEMNGYLACVRTVGRMECIQRLHWCSGLPEWTLYAKNMATSSLDKVQPGIRDMWVAVWANLASLPCLGELCVELRPYVCKETLNKEQEAAYIEPAWKVKLPGVADDTGMKARKWDLILHWEKCGTSFEGAPFRVFRYNLEPGKLSRILEH